MCLLKHILCNFNSVLKILKKIKLILDYYLYNKVSSRSLNFVFNTSIASSKCLLLFQHINLESSVCLLFMALLRPSLTFQFYLLTYFIVFYEPGQEILSFSSHCKFIKKVKNIFHNNLGKFILFMT